jgi:uncharacterized Ntn-hydrolase superfamily protein
LSADQKAGYGGTNNVLVEVGVDDHPEPVTELRRLPDLRNLHFGTRPATFRGSNCRFGIN